MGSRIASVRVCAGAVLRGSIGMKCPGSVVLERSSVGEGWAVRMRQAMCSGWCRTQPGFPCAFSYRPSSAGLFSTRRCH
jgi:hypothetical protein